MRADHRVAVFGEGLCLESIARASGALYLSSAARAHPPLAPSSSVNLSSMNYCRRSKMQIYDVNVYVSSLRLFQAFFFFLLSQAHLCPSTQDKHRPPTPSQLNRSPGNFSLDPWAIATRQLLPKVSGKHLILSCTNCIKVHGLMAKVLNCT